MSCPVVDEDGRGVVDAREALDILRQRMMNALRELDIDGALDIEGVEGFATGHGKIVTMDWLGKGLQGGWITEVTQSQRFVLIDFPGHARLEEAIALHELENELLAFSGLLRMPVRPIGVGALRKTAEK